MPGSLSSAARRHVRRHGDSRIANRNRKAAAVRVSLDRMTRFCAVRSLKYPQGCGKVWKSRTTSRRMRLFCLSIAAGCMNGLAVRRVREGLARGNQQDHAGDQSEQDHAHAHGIRLVPLRMPGVRAAASSSANRVAGSGFPASQDFRAGLVVGVHHPHLAPGFTRTALGIS